MKTFLTIFPSKFVNNISTLGPIGYWGKAPGTNGSFVGLLWYTLFFYQASLLGFWLLLAATTYIAILFCGESEVRMKKRDPKEVILDEMVAIPFCFIGLAKYMREGHMWLYMLIGFLLFRIFDIIKPFGIRKLQNFPGGYGVVIDDVAAALASCLCLHFIHYFWL